MGKTVKIGDIAIGGKKPLVLMAGPCVIESRAICMAIAKRLATWAEREKVPLVFKASYDKANRTSRKSFRGPGLKKGLEVLAEVKERFGLPIVTDIHGVHEVEAVSQVADILQIPAFLCRQTDLLVAAGESGCVVNVKKGQFLAPWDMKYVVEKVESTGNRNLILTERGASFGYNNLVSDMRSLLVMKEFGYPVVFDATHSVQSPGGAGGRSGGDGRWAPALARGAVAVGCDGLFIETHIHPEKALSDKDNAIALTALRTLWRQVSAIDEVV